MGLGAGAIVAYDLVTGDQKWKWSGGGPTYASPVLMMLDGVKTLVMHTETNLVGLGAADGRLLWQARVPTRQRLYSSVTQEQGYAYPIISGNRIYVKDKETLALWMLD